MERTVTSTGLDLWAEDLGNPEDPTILLIMGASTQSTAWPKPFLDRLVNSGRHVIRFDNRDTGLSSSVDFETAPYTLIDMAQDAVGVLDAFGVDKAHVVGASMGGMIAQEVAINHPERVLTLTSWMSTPSVSAPLTGEWSGGLPPIDSRVMDLFRAVAADPPTTLEGELDFAVEFARLQRGGLSEVDAEQERQEYLESKARARHPERAMQHSLAIAISRDRRDALGLVQAPTLVVHGTRDMMMPIEHAHATVAAIPGARLLVIPDMVHDFAVATSLQVADAIVEHTS
jgi:pimeloyl-ACP methyl ester carboxylesterase